MMSSSTGTDGGLYLTAQQAADMLGISVQSLYAYVGRKNIRSQGTPGKRSRLYWREDIERISGGMADERVVKFDSILVPETKITLLTASGHYYRGVSAIALSENATLEDVAALLWAQPKDTIFSSVPPPAPAGFKKLRAALSGLSASDQAGSLFAVLEAANPRNYDRTAFGFARTGAELIRWFVAMVVADEKPSAEPVHLVLARGYKASEVFTDLIRRLLVLFADHELTSPTYAVRALANTGATPYQAVAAGLIAIKGARIGEGRAPAIRRLLAEIRASSDPAQPIIERYRAGDTIPGFSHSIYKGGDARARALLKTLTQTLVDDPDYARLLKAIRVAHEGPGAEPDLSLLAYYIDSRLQPPDSSVSIQVIARLVGWIAHAYEQTESGPMMRPRTAYTGVLLSTIADREQSAHAAGTANS